MRTCPTEDERMNCRAGGPELIRSFAAGLKVCLVLRTRTKQLISWQGDAESHDQDIFLVYFK